MLQQVEALLFDKDGTLFDFTKTWGGWARDYLLSISTDEISATELGHQVGFDIVQKVFRPGSIIIAATPREISEEIAALKPELSAQQIYDDMNSAAAQILPVEAVPLAPLLKEFRARGLALGISTNDTEEPTFANLAHLEITGLFDFVSASDSGYIPKPAPDSLLAFAGKVGVEPGAVAMVGDSTHDLEAGRAAGMVTIGVLTGPAGQDELEPWADVILQDIGKIPALLSAR